MIDPKKSEAMNNIFRELHDANINEFSKSFVVTLLRKHDLDLEDKVAQFYLQDWHRRTIIELMGEEAVYLRVLKRGVELRMLSVLAIVADERFESRKDTFSKSTIVSYISANRLELENEEVQAVLQKWHNEG